MVSESFSWPSLFHFDSDPVKNYLSLVVGEISAAISRKPGVKGRACRAFSIARLPTVARPYKITVSNSNNLSFYINSEE
jgi:hypothetical protein